MWAKVIERLQKGERVKLRPRGNSMMPIIRSGQEVTLTKLQDPPKIGDVVLARVRGRYYLHKVTAVDRGKYRISNNHGHHNGWTRKVYAKVEVS